MATKIFGNDENVVIIEKCININKPLLLVGETGTGKTTAVRLIAEKNKKYLHRVNLNGQTTKEDLIGKFLLINGETKRVDGMLVSAMKRGDRFLCDEINAALPEILFVLQSVLESNDKKLGKLFIPENNEVVEPHPDFRFFATMNPSYGYIGTKDLNQATENRFIKIIFSPLDYHGEMQLLLDKYGDNKDIGEERISAVARVIHTIRSMFFQEKISFYPSTRDSVYITELIASGLSLGDATNTVILNKLNKDDKNIVVEEINKMNINVKTQKERMDTIGDSKRTIDSLNEKIRELDANVEHAIQEGNKHLREQLNESIKNQNHLRAELSIANKTIKDVHEKNIELLKTIDILKSGIDVNSIKKVLDILSSSKKDESTDNKTTVKTKNKG